MSNRSPKILWPIDYSSMTSISHWCNWLLIDDLSITNRLLYSARKTLFLLACTIFLLSVLDTFFLVSELPVDDVKQPVWKWNSQVRWQESTSWLSIFFLWVFVSKVKLLWLRETSVISSYITSLVMSIEYLYKFRVLAFEGNAIPLSFNWEFFRTATVIFSAGPCFIRSI